MALSTLIEATTVSIDEDELEEDDELADEDTAEEAAFELALLDAVLEADALFSDEEELFAATGPHEAKTKSEDTAKTKRNECFLINEPPLRTRG